MLSRTTLVVLPIVAVWLADDGVKIGFVDDRSLLQFGLLQALRSRLGSERLRLAVLGW